jgi:hypothetical protein
VAHVIISASYKTDIPAFYGEWFMNRLRAGYCNMVNPYGRQVYRVSLERPDVDAFVFWTKNIGPFLPHLPEIGRRGYPFMVQHTINGYPRSLEFSVVRADRSVAHMKQLAADYGPRVAVWRYDPVVISSETPPDFHRRNFAALAGALAGSTDEVVISFAHMYKKTKRNLDAAARSSGFTWSDPDDEVKRELAAEFAQVAHAHGMQLTVCSQAAYLVPGSAPARCVDAARLSDIAGRLIPAAVQGNRPDCGCYQSRDIGHYDTCPHGCVYCYAVQERDLAQQRFHQHDPAGEFLFTPEGAAADTAPADKSNQLRFQFDAGGD